MPARVLEEKTQGHFCVCVIVDGGIEPVEISSRSATRHFFFFCEKQGAFLSFSILR